MYFGGWIEGVMHALNLIYSEIYSAWVKNAIGLVGFHLLIVESLASRG